MATQRKRRRQFPVSFRWGMDLGTTPITTEQTATLKKTGLKAVRLVVDWSALQPAPDTFDPEAISYLRQSLTAMRKNRLRSRLVVTGTTLPPWFSRLGGWSKSENLEHFHHFLTGMAAGLGDLVTEYIILDRPNRLVSRSGEISGFSSDQSGICNYFLNQRALRNIVIAHCRIYDQIREIHARRRFRSPEISISLEVTPLGPANPENELDLDRTTLAHQRHHLLLLEALTEGLLPTPLGRRERIHDGPAWDYLELVPTSPCRIRFDWTGIDRSFLKKVPVEAPGRPDLPPPSPEEELLPLLKEIQNQVPLPLDLILPTPVQDPGHLLRIEEFQKLAFLRNGGLKLRGCFFHSLLDKILPLQAYDKPAARRKKKRAASNRSRTDSPLQQLEKIFKNGIFDSADR